MCFPLLSKQAQVLLAAADCDCAPREHPLLLKMKQLVAGGSKKEGTQLVLYFLTCCSHWLLACMYTDYRTGLKVTFKNIIDLSFILSFFLIFFRHSELVAGVYGRIGKLVPLCLLGAFANVWINRSCYVSWKLCMTAFVGVMV